MKNFILSIPLFLRLIIRDTIEGGVGTALALTLVGDTNTVFHAILAGFITAGVSAIRRYSGDFLIWLNSVLGTTPDLPTSSAVPGPPVETTESGLVIPPPSSSPPAA